MGNSESGTEQEVAALAQSFRAYWGERLGRSPRYRLDYSWPSVGVVELLLDDAHRQKDEGHDLSNLFLGAAAYLSVIITACWRRLPDRPTVTARLTRDARPAIILEATGGAYLKDGERYRLPLSAALTSLVETRPQPLPIWQNAPRDLPPRLFGLSAAMLGICCGRSPLGAGAWLSRADAEWRANTDTVSVVLAQTSAEYYAANFPSEPTGGDPNLYLGGCIAPPPSIDEERFCLRALTALMRHLMSRDLTAEAKRTVTLNLAASPDETFSLVGAAAAIALHGDSPPPKLVTLVDSLGPIRLLLLPLVSIARGLLGDPPTPLDRAQDGAPDDAVRLLVAEQRLSLLPLLHLPPRLILRAELRPLIELLYWGNIDKASAFIDELSLVGELDPGVAIQRAFLALEDGHIDRAEELLNRYRERARADGDVAHTWFECALRLSLTRRDFIGALALAEEGASTPGNPDARARLSQLSVDLLLASKQPADAWDRATAILDEDPHALGASLSKLEIDLFYGGSEEVDQELDRVIRLAPMHPRTFQAVLWADAVKRQEHTG